MPLPSTYEERLRELQARLRTADDPSLSDEAFLEAQDRDAAAAKGGRISAALQGAFSRGQVTPVERESEAKALMQARALRAQGIDEAAKRTSALGAAEDTLRGLDSTSLENQAASGFFRKYLPGVIPPELKERMTRDAAQRLLPYAKEGIDIEAKRLEASERAAKEAAASSALRSALRTEFRDRLGSLPIDSYGSRQLELLYRSLDDERRQKSGQTFTANQGELNRQTTLAAAGVAAGAAAEKEGRDEARRLEGLAGPAGLVPKQGRRPTEADSRQLAAAWTTQQKMAPILRRLRGLVAQHGPEGIAADGALRAEAESLVGQAQLEAKGITDLQLGVLAGPDVAFLQRIFPETSSPMEVLKALIGQGGTDVKLDEAIARNNRIWTLHKEGLGYSQPGDADYDAAKQAFSAATAPARQANIPSGEVPVWNVQTGEMRLFPASRARLLSADPSKFSLKPPRR